MKKFLTWLAVGMMACGLSVGAFAAGPLVGLQVAPIAASNAALMFGYDFGSVSLEFNKPTLNTINGLLESSIVWTPEYASGFGYRAGAQIETNLTATVFTFNNIWFIAGVSQTWSPFQVYGELAFTSATGTLALFPRIGVNFLIGDLFPVKNTVE